MNFYSVGNILRFTWKINTICKKCSIFSTHVLVGGIFPWRWKQNSLGCWRIEDIPFCNRCQISCKKRRRGCILVCHPLSKLLTRNWIVAGDELFSSNRFLVVFIGRLAAFYVVLVPMEFIPSEPPQSAYVIVSFLYIASRFKGD